MSVATVPTGPGLRRSALLPSWAQWGVPAVFVVLAILGAIATDLGIGLLLVLAVLVSLVVLYAWSRSVEGGRKALDRAVTLGVSSAFVLAVLPLISVLITVIGRGSHRFDGDFFTLSMRNVIGAGGGALHAIVGTLLISGCATVVAVPVGILAAVYLVEYGRGRLARCITFFVDVMTGVPSIVAGLFAFALFELFFGPGIRLGIMGSVALMVLMIPIVVRSTEEMLRIVPDGLREAAFALGTPKWRVVTKIVLPTALAGIVSGVMLSIARIMGETAPLLVTAGTIDSMNYNPFDGRMANLAVYAFDEYKNPGVLKQAFLDRAWAAALTLIVIVMLLNLVGRFVYRRFGTEIR